jgi:hypothetical protein
MIGPTGSGARPRRRLAVAASVAILASLSPVTAGASVRLAAVAAQATVPPGGTIDVELRIAAPGSAFNGYDAVIGFDPDVLSLVPTPLVEREGPLMTEACANRFHVLQSDTTAGDVSIAHVLLCAGVSVTGPGTVYRLRFRAGPEDAVTHVRLLPGTAFYLAGEVVAPVVTTDARIVVGSGTAAPADRPPATPQVSAWPNPFNPRTTIRCVATEPGLAHLRVHDLRGIAVRDLFTGPVSAGEIVTMWDGRSDDGRPVPSGRYILRLQVGRHASSRGVTLIR